MDYPKIWHYPDEAQRRQWQNPEAILEKIGLKPGHTFMDVGCGAGFFMIPAARIVGAKGQVYGLDSQCRAIDELRQKAANEGLTNIEAKEGTAEETLINYPPADIVFLANTLHDFRDPARVLENAHRLLKPGGKLANLDWKKIKMSLGPSYVKRFDETTAAHLIKSAGFHIESIDDSGPYHYLIIARRS